jgi:hypothetical protein
MWADSLHVRTNIILFGYVILILYTYLYCDAEFKSGVSLGLGRHNIPERRLTDSASESQVLASHANTSQVPRR